MKFKFKPEKGNLLLMTSIIILLLVTCLFWLVIREYIYFAVYLLLTLFIAYTYYFTSYFIKEDVFIIRLGIIKIKLKYNNIQKIEELKTKVKIYLKNIKFDVYPNNVEIFAVKLNSKLTNKNSHNIINKK